MNTNKICNQLALDNQHRQLPTNARAYSEWAFKYRCCRLTNECLFFELKGSQGWSISSKPFSHVVLHNQIEFPLIDLDFWQEGNEHFFFQFIFHPQTNSRKKKNSAKQIPTLILKTNRLLENILNWIIFEIKLKKKTFHFLRKEKRIYSNQIFQKTFF